MSESDAPTPPRQSRLVLAAVVFAVGLAADLWSKAWAWNNLKPPGESVTVIDPLFELSYSFNTGAAFGFLNRFSWAREFFIVVTLLALVYMLWLALKMPTTKAYGFIAVALVASGAAGNLHDRIVRADGLGRHGVVDFLKLNYPWGGSWPTFNIADVALLVGVGLLFLYIRYHVDAPAKEAAEKDAAETAAAEGDDNDQDDDQGNDGLRPAESASPADPGSEDDAVQASDKTDDARA